MKFHCLLRSIRVAGNYGIKHSLVEICRVPLNAFIAK